MSRLLSLMRWTAALTTLLVLALLAWQCIDIYLDGNAAENLDANGVHLTSVYRMDDVGIRLSRFAVPLGLYVLFIAVTGVFHVIWSPVRAARMTVSPDNRLRLLKARISELPDAAKGEERFRRNVQIGCTLLMVLFAIPCLVYLLNGSNFTSWDLENVMGSMMLHVAPWVIAAFLCAITGALICERSVQREVDALKGAPTSKKAENQDSKGRCPIHVLRIALYALAVLFIVLGVMNGGLRDVLVKAINICTECIGLG